MKRSGHAKRWWWIIVGLAVAAALAWTLKPEPVASTTALVTRGTLAATVRAEGRARVRDLYVVAAPVDGQLERVTVQPGDGIDVNGSVATIRPAESRPLDARTRAEAKAAVVAAKAAVARAEAAEEEARVALEHADSQRDTTRKLAASGAATANDLTHRGHESEMRKSGMAAATAALAQARAELARAQSVVGTESVPGQLTSVRSPIAGRILRVLRESAGPIATGTPLVEVGDVKRLEVDADLLSSDAAEVREGAAATITGWGGPQPLLAHVRRIDPAAFTKVSALGLEEQRAHVVLDLADPPPSGLGHDYRVDVAIVVWEGKDVVRVPSTALFRVGDRWATFRVLDGRARKMLVEVGATDRTLTVVTNGLREGDEVITQPSDAIADGTRVRRR